MYVVKIGPLRQRGSERISKLFVREEDARRYAETWHADIPVTVEQEPYDHYEPESAPPEEDR